MTAGRACRRGMGWMAVKAHDPRLALAGEPAGSVRDALPGDRPREDEQHLRGVRGWGPAHRQPVCGQEAM